MKARIGWGGAIAMAMALPAAAQDRPSDGITLTAQAWSTAPNRWTIHRDGSIDDARGAQSFAPTLPIDMVSRHLPPSPGRYAVIERLLAPARQLANRTIACESTHTDDSGGVVIWPDGTRLGYSFGCDGAANRPIVDAVRAASTQVGAWTAQAPVVRRYQIATSEELLKQ